LLEVGTHWLFGLLELMGHDSVISCTATTDFPEDESTDSENQASRPCERSCRANISLQNEVSVEVDIQCVSDVAIAAHKDIYEMTVYGSCGVGSSAPSYTLYDFTKLREDRTGHDIIPGGSYGRMECVEEFVKAVLQGSSEGADLVTPVQARNVQELIIALKAGGRR
jgi:predicted dehydrogenase